VKEKGAGGDKSLLDTRIKKKKRKKRRRGSEVDVRKSYQVDSAHSDQRMPPPKRMNAAAKPLDKSIQKGKTGKKNLTKPSVPRSQTVRPGTGGGGKEKARESGKKGRNPRVREFLCS